MTLIRDIPLSLTMEHILRRQGMGDISAVPPKILALSRELLDEIATLQSLEPAIAYEFCPVKEINAEGARLQGQKRLPFASELAAIVCTIGPQLEGKVTDYFAHDEPLHGVLLDGIGSAAVDILAQEACRMIGVVAGSRGNESSSPLSPGMPGLPLSEQRALCRIAQAEKIGVHLSNSAMMIPRKSISMLVGIGPKMPTWTKAQVCSECVLKKTCRYKIGSSRLAENKK
ncbi:MAG: hypothetical protein JRJ21_03165 [Deltaproteobacteria bacterium]|nr:hypothetical protein [Deltaproteobacteria bacterium]